MDKKEMIAEIHRLAPFHHDIELPNGLKTYVPDRARRHGERTRLSSLIKHVWPSLISECGGTLEGKRVLDIACNCGGFSVEAAKSGAEYVLGTDVSDHYLEQANFVKQALSLENVQFRKIAVEEMHESDIGMFDVTFCFGILYHLENPVLGMRKIAECTKNLMIVDTAVEKTPFSRKATWVFKIPEVTSMKSQNASTSLWRNSEVCQFTPNKYAVVRLLNYLGFPHVTEVIPKHKGLQKRYYKGKRVSFIATRGEPTGSLLTEAKW